MFLIWNQYNFGAFLQDIPDHMFRHTRLLLTLLSLCVNCWVYARVDWLHTVSLTSNIGICRPSNCITLYIKHGDKFSIYNHETKYLIHINVKNISFNNKKPELRISHTWNCYYNSHKEIWSFWHKFFWSGIRLWNLISW